jgi:capsular polysaccharide export protein
MIGIYSKGIAQIPFLESFLQDEVILNPKNSCPLSYIAGWGRKPSAAIAIKKAEKRNIPYLSLEDGFIRSVGLGVHETRRFSLIVDPVGIYYDATQPSRLENMLNQDVFSNELLNEARECIDFIVKNRISKYNHTTKRFTPDNHDKKNILLVDQTANDMSVELGLADAGSFKQMYEHALKSYPDENIYIKVHPDVIAGKKKGYLSELPLNSSVKVISEDTNPIDLIYHMDHVMVVTSQLGFEALLLGKKVSCFGIPFYANWGLTEDHLTCGRRKKKRSVLELFAAAYLCYPSYIRPDTGVPGRLMDVLQYIVIHKSQAKENKVYYAVGFPVWKRQFIRPFFDRNVNLKFVSSQTEVAQIDDCKYVVWSYQAGESVKTLPESQIERIEDGFFRSVGLGSNFHAPWSLVKDGIGMYFNPQTPSRLEEILNTQTFDDMDLKEARLIREYIVEQELSKYNTDSSDEPNIHVEGNRKVLFVPGQVADDASILYGCTNRLRSIEGLLTYLREMYPDAFILFKPHPDVVKRNRQGMHNDDVLSKLCDHVETKASVLQCIKRADEVHTLTSQTGFDALLRGKKVFTYGGPFYAGWGLTTDLLDFPRRMRKLSIDELVAGALIYYPNYYNWDLKQQADCRSVLRKLVSLREKKSNVLLSGLLDTNKTRWLRRYLHLSREILGCGK